MCVGKGPCIFFYLIIYLPYRNRTTNADMILQLMKRISPWSNLFL
jgi:hypothetical protein